MKVRGKVKGQSIVFDEPLDLLDGQAVEAEIHPVLRNILEQYGFRPIPKGGSVVTNDLVNEIGEELGI